MCTVKAGEACCLFEEERSHAFRCQMPSHIALKMYVQEHEGVPGSKKRLRCSGLGEVAHLFSLLSCWMWPSAAPFDRSRVGNPFPVH